MGGIDFHPNYESLNLDKFRMPSDGYESPLTMLVSDIHNRILEQQENAIVAQIQAEYGISCDKEELIKALNYDRGQYDKGYQYGFNSGYYKGYETAKQEILGMISNLDAYSINQIQQLITEIEKLRMG